MATNNNGITYYKLDAELHGYSGDVTKNCGLRGEEIDGNFNFLRGNDIESISYDNKGTIYVKKYNGEILSTDKFNIGYDFNYDSEEGVLTITTPKGEEIKLDGFKTSAHVFHDNTLKGNGTRDSILSLSNITKTGRYLPVIKLIDLSEKDENGNPIKELPKENNALHDRYLTKEFISSLGRLYSLNGVLKISEKLNEISSEWHVPSKEEWDEMLNTIDCVNPNHDKIESNVELGEDAGSLLKGIDYWKPNENGEILSYDSYNFKVIPVGYCGNRGKSFYGSFGESSAFWTSTVESNHNDMYIKCFNYDKKTVGQHTWGENFYLSLRLVKKFNGDNYNSSENINGLTVNCVHIPGTNTVWTSENISFSEKEFDSFVPEEWNEIIENEASSINNPHRYFINDWNGNDWDKHEVKEGESIIIKSHENGEMHEWMIVNGQLIDTVSLVLSQTSEILDNINNRLETEISTRELEDVKLQDNIDAEKSERENADKQLQSNIDVESSNRENADKQLQVNIDAEKSERESTDEQLQVNIDVESSNRENADKQLQSNIDAEKNERTENITTLTNAINNEVQNRVNAINSLKDIFTQNVNDLSTVLETEISTREIEDTKLKDEISNERTERENADKQLQDNIDAEKSERESTDEQLQVNIDIEKQNREDAIRIESESRISSDNLIKKLIEENKLIIENDSIVIVPGNTDENGNTISTTIKVNIDQNCEHIKLEEYGIYFNGNFGQF